MKTVFFPENIPPSHHCYSGSEWRIFQHASIPVSEEMILGLGAGVGFIYWHMKGTDPFLGGRTNVGRPGGEGMEITAARRLGIQASSFQSDSGSKAEKLLIDSLRNGVPVMLQVDMGYLPYFKDMGDFHFSGHVVAACGLDEENQQVCLADREERLYWVGLEDLRKARSSQYPPFKPRHRAVTFNFDQFHQPAAEDVLTAVREAASGMLHPPITNLGVKGILKASQRISQWSKDLTDQQLKTGVFNLWIFIDATGGTGGGIFRYMYGRFLNEAAALTGKAELAESGRRMHEIGDSWQEVALLGKEMFETSASDAGLNQVSQKLKTIAAMEQDVWQQLASIVG